ncbi:MAG: anhydro-N-acetylmuramic acid kinase, partial [Gemmatimonadota bacterium]
AGGARDARDAGRARDAGDAGGAVMWYVGLMSGTSLDGIDAVLADVSGAPPHLRATVRHHLHVEYSADQRARIRKAIEAGAAELCRLDFDVGAWLADATWRLLREARFDPRDLRAIGSHGQTVWHEPPAGTLQLGEAAVIAERVGVPVISDFRTRDVAAGGQGAPLVPIVDAWLFRHEARRRAMQNLGGIANVTLLPPAGADDALVAFDTGPGVGVLDAVVEIVTEGRQCYDDGGALAARGRVLDRILSELLDDSYFAAPPPKSTGRERFGSAYARDLVERARVAGASSEDVVATATALTARSIARAYHDFLAPRGGVDECVLSGGGALNPALVRMLREALAPVPVSDVGALGVDPQAKEALAFAVHAHAHLEEIAGNFPEVTGAAGPRTLGKRTPA